ncbi:NUDIX hydrolase [Gordonibacter sp. An230]|uniref:NUDIX hydrolase n=1 Tax=Gordonibacter sp. An230 TaxID=1965592 RepID=UPI000B3A35A5|nr:NUDIX hydrolase [Gordonibacter sp. An230]OUO90461.1 NUDIX hydrolase [Gordonibacter sp. An230]
MPLIDDIRAYRPFNEQEEVDREIILRQLESDPDVFDRSSLAHVTCSIWTVDPTAAKTLMVHHNVYSSWSWIGGHADGERDLIRVALRELEEETGVADARLVASCGPGGIFSLEVLTVDGHEKRHRYVSPHLHLNVTYLAVASSDESLRAKPDENDGVRWMTLDEALASSTEPWIRDRIYRKLVDKLSTVDVGRDGEPAPSPPGKLATVDIQRSRTR